MDEYVYDALRAGASGFLLKDVPPEQLVDGIRSVANGDALLAPSITRRLIEEFVRAAPAQGTRPSGLDELTPREVEVLQLIARGLSNAEIAEELFVSETTVKTHVAHVLMKLDLRDRVQAVVLAYESGSSSRALRRRKSARLFPEAAVRSAQCGALWRSVFSSSPWVRLGRNLPPDRPASSSR